MTLQDLPLVGRVLAFGPDDHVYDSLILSGPIVVVLLAVAGRNPLTIALALGYIFAFVIRVGSQALASGET